VEARQRWEALQAHLTAARTACDAGDRDKALEHVDAALAIDPSFLAAHWLRERVLAPPEPASPALAADAAPSAPLASVVAETSVKPPLVSAEGYGRFEQRARRRRVDRRIDAARVAIERRRLKDAAAALDEVIELDPNLPELSELTAEFDELRRTVATTHHGRWIAAVAVLVIGMFGLWSQDSEYLLPHAKVGSPLLVAPPKPVVTVMVSFAAPVATTGERERPVEAPPSVLMRGISPAEPVERKISRAEPEEHRIGRAEPVGRGISRAAPVERGISRADTMVVNGPSAIARRSPATLLPVRGAPVAAPPAVVAPPLQRPPALPRPPQERPAVTATASPASSASPESPAVPAAMSIPAVDDELLIKQTLQRYRHAYEGLDAQSAQAVYPALNQAALARAFDGLHSQSLAFDACDMHVRGGSATATCHGSARYVPKIGSREPHTEPRVWSFTLRKNGGDWQIENARAER
jgi:tetratricopeptide (TPR) repeat protein